MMVENTSADLNWMIDEDLIAHLLIGFSRLFEQRMMQCFPFIHSAFFPA